MEHVGREQTEQALGERWTFGRWDRAVWADFFAYARTVLPNPVEVAAKSIDKLPQPAAEFLVRCALDKACSYLSVGSPEVQSFLSSIEGGSYLAYLLLRKHHPTLSEDDAFNVFMAMSQVPAQSKAHPNRMAEIFGLCSGKAKGGKGEAPAV